MTQKKEAPADQDRAGATIRSLFKTAINNPDFRTANDGQQAPDGKVTATLIAKFALRGHAVHDGGNHDFIVVQKNWGHTRYCQDADALKAFAVQLGVKL
jgi:hypothetical protein